MGSLTVSAANIDVDAPIVTSGGTIELSATEQITIAPAGGLSTTAAAIGLAAPQITQQGIITDSDGGSVSLDAGTDGTLLDSGIIDASSTVAGHTGGSVELLGEYVGLTGSAVVNVSGSAGGGTVLVGGGYHGADPAVENAARTYVGQDVTIEANAITSGNGGQITIWSEEATWFYGQIEAQGGATGGNGGFAEISSRQNLTEQGLVDLSAPQGQLGSLLLDPETITIVHAGSAAQDVNLPTVLFADTPTDFSISDSALAASNTNILLQAGDTITIDDLGGVLTLQNNVNITLETRNDTSQADTATGGITFLNTTNGLQTTGSGTITLAAGVNAATDGTFTQTQGTADITAGALSTAGGAITIVASRNVTFNGAVTTTDGALNITAGDVNILGALDSGTATTTIQTAAAETIGIGSAAGGLAISSTELSNITAATLVVGGTTTTSITVSTVDQPVYTANIGLLTRWTG